jgi:hypothetical protein
MLHNRGWRAGAWALLALALLLAPLDAAAARAGPRQLHVRQLQQAPAPGPGSAPTRHSVTVINRCSRGLNLGISYPFNTSDPTQAGMWCTNFQTAWQSGWCSERPRAQVPPGGALSSHETTPPLLGTTSYVTAFQNNVQDIYMPGYSAGPQCLDINALVFCDCSFLNCVAWFEVGERAVGLILSWSVCCWQHNACLCPVQMPNMSVQRMPYTVRRLAAAATAGAAAALRSKLRMSTTFLNCAAMQVETGSTVELYCKDDNQLQASPLPEVVTPQPAPEFSPSPSPVNVEQYQVSNVFAPGVAPAPS